VVGRTIHYIGDRNSKPDMDMTITAVIADVPNNSTIYFNSSSSFNAVGSLSTYYAVKPSGVNIDEDWGNWMYSTFVMFKQNDLNSFTNKVNKLWLEQEKIRGNNHVNINLIPLDDVHFHNNSKRQIIFLLQLIGVFILGIAIINFVNLTIARSSSRAREIGMRKVVGANRLMLIKQFLSESIFISLLAMLITLLIVTLFKPFFFKMINKEIPFDILFQPQFILILITCIVIIGIISGFYPAVILSSFKPTSILKGEITKSKRGNLLRHVLIILQFTISISLIICTILISKQVDYLKTKDLGFNNKNIIHFSQSQQINKNYDLFKQKLLQNPDILNVSRSNTSFGRDLPIGLESDFKGLKKSYRASTVDPDFIPAMKIEMVKGRPFSWDIKSDHYMTVIVNETFVKEFQLKQPLGAEINFFTIKPKIIGVMKDFNYNSFHQKVEPAALLYIDWNMEINVRIDSRNVSGTIQYIKDKWNEFCPEMQLDYKFLDQTYGALYTSEEQFQSIISSFSIVAIIIACLGLYGLVSHNVNSRLKEISIRKILGASVDSIVIKLIGEFIKWVLLANIIAWPLAWFLMNKWLQNFAYHASMNLWIFIISGGIALLIAILTISYQAIKAATTNPIEALRYE
jgi:putative ABC transport system permease protein